MSNNIQHTIDAIRAELPSVAWLDNMGKSLSVTMKDLHEYLAYSDELESQFATQQAELERLQAEVKILNLEKENLQAMIEMAPQGE